MNSSAEVKAEIIRRINERIWLPGDRLPREVELAQEFACSRSTVNKAMQQLANNGLLVRRRKAGTRVATHPVRTARIQIPIIRHEVESLGARYRHRVLYQCREYASVSLQQKFAIDRRRKWLHLQTLHYKNETSYLFEDRWINLAVAGAILQLDLATVSANEWLVQHMPFTHGAQSLAARNATNSDAQLLQCRLDEALLTVERTTWSDQVPITHVLMVYAPGHQIGSSL